MQRCQDCSVDFRRKKWEISTRCSAFPQFLHGNWVCWAALPQGCGWDPHKQAYRYEPNARDNIFVFNLICILYIYILYIYTAQTTYYIYIWMVYSCSLHSTTPGLRACSTWRSGIASWRAKMRWRRGLDRRVQRDDLKEIDDQRVPPP